MANFILTQTGQQIQDDLDLLDNNQATSGQVLTADGTGGASWATPSGGDKLYRHDIRLHAGNMQVILTLYTTQSTSFTLESLYTFLSSNYSTNSFSVVCVNYDTQNNKIWKVSTIMALANMIVGNAYQTIFTTDGTNISISINWTSTSTYVFNSLYSDTITEVV